MYKGGLYSFYDKKPITFYINKDTMDNDVVIYSLIDEMFNYKYKQVIWYCHNFGDFDSLFIRNVLGKYNKSKAEKV